MVTVEESIREKIEKGAKWRKENPWHSPEYPQDESKIYITKELLESEAYRSLSRCSLLIYQDFLSKREMVLIKRNRKKIWVSCVRWECPGEGKERPRTTVRFKFEDVKAFIERHYSTT